MKLLALLGVGYVGVAGLLYFAQTWLLFPGAGRPSQRLDHARAHERLVLPSGDRRSELHGLLFSTPAEDAELLIGFGGNGQDAESLAHDLARDFPDQQVAVFHYRGYGPSTGTPSQAALLADAVTIYDALTERERPRRCFAIGISLGSAVAAYLSKARPLAGIMLVTPFDSIAAIAKETYFWLPVDLLLRHRFPTVEFMADNATPVAVIAADRDRVVRPERTQALVEELSNLVSYQMLTDAAHNTLYQLPNFEQALETAFAALRNAADQSAGGGGDREENRAMSDLAAPAKREIRSVLHPTDLTPASTPAFVHALRLATSGRAKLYVLHADPAHVEETDWDAFPAVRGTLTSWGLLEAGSAPGAVFEKLGLQVAKIRMTDRDPVRGILRFLEDHPSDLIVLATEGREGLPRWLHGSVAEPVARSAETLTLFIPHGVRGFVGAEDGTVSLRRLLIPIDRRPQPRWALRAAWEIARLLGAEGAILQLLHVGSELEPSAVPVEPNTFAKIEHLVRTGDVVEQILAVARDGPADLIVMATEGHQGFLDALRGSTTERVLRQAPCPVLAVPSR